MTGNSPSRPTWYVETMAPRRERPSLTYDIDVDVCVIGGGLAGLTVAREVARRGWSVAVLEAQQIASNASGRNGGCVLPGFSATPERIIERVGFDRAKALWGLSLGGVEYVRNAIREIGMPGVEPIQGWLSVQRIDDAAALAASAELIGDKLGTEVEVWPTERLRSEVKTERYFQGLYMPGAFHIHPLNYALGIAAAAEQAGAQIYERTPALAIDPAGVRKRIDVPGARVRAGYIVLAGGPHLAALFPLVSQAILPLATQLAVTEPLGGALADALTYRGALADTRRVFEYYRIVDGDRLMWGGHVSARLSTPRRLKKIFQRDIRRVFPQLGKVAIANAWTGIMGFAVHKMPQIGEVSPGLWVASAFGGHGLNTTAMAGELIARAMIEGDDRWRLFETYDLVWAGGLAGRAMAQAVYWSKQARDVIDEWRPRRHHEAAPTVAAEPAMPLAPGDSGPSHPPTEDLESPVKSEQASEKIEASSKLVAEAQEQPSPSDPTPGRANRVRDVSARTDAAVFATRDPQSGGEVVKRQRANRAGNTIADPIPPGMAMSSPRTKKPRRKSDVTPPSE